MNYMGFYEVFGARKFSFADYFYLTSETTCTLEDERSGNHSLTIDYGFDLKY